MVIKETDRLQELLEEYIKGLSGVRRMVLEEQKSKILKAVKNK